MSTPKESYAKGYFFAQTQTQRQRGTAISFRPHSRMASRATRQPDLSQWSHEWSRDHHTSAAAEAMDVWRRRKAAVNSASATRGGKCSDGLGGAS